MKVYTIEEAGYNEMCECMKKLIKCFKGLIDEENVYNYKKPRYEEEDWMERNRRYPRY